LFRKVTF